ncbi:MAG: hypothetical protein HYV68_03030 [Candidatus Taylorbacteria bacterium]|nr:hypothetical protein [Candidatus Taylorbacteria bacterium]
MKKTIVLKRTFPIRVGVYNSADGYLRALNEYGMRVTSKVVDLLGDERQDRKFFRQAHEDVTLGDVSVDELGLPNNALYGDILFEGMGRRVIWQGKMFVLSKALPEDGLELRLTYKTQPKDEWLRIAMDGVEHPMGNKMILMVVHGQNGILYLDTDDGGDPDDPFDDHVRFIWRLIPQAS